MAENWWSMKFHILFIKHNKWNIYDKVLQEGNVSFFLLLNGSGSQFLWCEALRPSHRNLKSTASPILWKSVLVKQTKF